MDTPMFCYQCEQTGNGGRGCTLVGVCGKDSTVSALQDLLVYQLAGLAYYGDQLLERGQSVDPETTLFLIDGLFSTLTNVNFNPQSFLDLLRQAQSLKAGLKAAAGGGTAPVPPAAAFILPVDDAAIQADAQAVNIRPDAEVNPDLQSLRDTLLYGIKGMAAYARHAWALGYRDESVIRGLYRGMTAAFDAGLDAGGLLNSIMAFGQVNLKCMELLDRANTTTFGDPEPTAVRITHRKGPFIVVSGHDLADLGQLLEQTAGKGVQVYTHGEMLPAHGYPGLKKYPHLAGNYGGAWQNQQREFTDLPGAILMTTNCLLEPRPSYEDRIFTTSVVGWPGVPHIAEKNGVKDFSPVIERALALGGWTEDEEERTILTGFGHAAVLGHAGAIIDAVKTGQIKHFFLIGGCDGAKPGRNYYTDLAEQTPKDSVILTLACGKYRFNKLDFGTVAGLPRLLDIGQCNDAYSAIQVALALADAFQCSVNDLPLTLVLSWFEQKAVCILLTLLSLGIKNMYLGPTLPAFITPNVLQILVDQYSIKPISTPEADLAAILN
ncbi:MAG TPA: hydroxylamine reductase [Anaerolineae bacterium]